MPFPAGLRASEISDDKKDNAAQIAQKNDTAVSDNGGVQDEN